MGENIESELQKHRFNVQKLFDGIRRLLDSRQGEFFRNLENDNRISFLWGSILFEFLWDLTNVDMGT